MLYAKVINNIVTQYPLTVFQLRTMYPHVSWPDSPSEEALAQYNLVIVYEIVQPTVKRNQVLTEGTPEYNSLESEWEQTWVITNKNGSEAKTKEKERLGETRYDAETAGIPWEYALNDTVTIDTDRESQSKLMSAYVMAQNGLWQTGKNWKFKNSQFRPLTPEQMVSVALTVAAYVQLCFEHEKTIADQIDAATTIEDIENWSW